MTDCGANSLLASWSASLGATSYTATVMGPHGFTKTCSSSNLTCYLSDLRCGTQYNITVTSKNDHCTSSATQTAVSTGGDYNILHVLCKLEAFPRLQRHHVTHGLSLPLTGPCDPVNVTSLLQCGSNMATVSWDHAAGAVGYTVFARQDTHLVTSCRSNATTCILNRLECGKVYNLTVTAESATNCNSSGNNSTILKTGRKEKEKEFRVRSVSLHLHLFLHSQGHARLLFKTAP